MVESVIRERTERGERSRQGAWDGLEDLRDGMRAFIARQCSDEHDVEDVVQETFLRAARYRRQHCVKRLRPWAMRIALHVLADARRRGNRLRTTTPQEEGFDPPEPPPSGAFYCIGGEWIEAETACALMREALEGLRAEDQQLLAMFYAEGKTEIVARHCGLPRRVIKVRLYRARKRLGRALENRVRREHDERRLAS